MGCVLYELVCCKRLFNSDEAVSEYWRQHRMNGRLVDISQVASTQWLDEQRKTFVSRTIRVTLEIEPEQRPSSEWLEQRFKVGWSAEHSSSSSTIGMTPRSSIQTASTETTQGTPATENQETGTQAEPASPKGGPSAEVLPHTVNDDEGSAGSQPEHG
jgi:hypothetical protein